MSFERLQTFSKWDNALQYFQFMQNGNGWSSKFPVACVSRNVRATTPAVSASRVRDSIAVRPSLLHLHERKKNETAARAVH